MPTSTDTAIHTATATGADSRSVRRFADLDDLIGPGCGKQVVDARPESDNGLDS
jgi:hypothetical protein